MLRIQWEGAYRARSMVLGIQGARSNSSGVVPCRGLLVLHWWGPRQVAGTEQEGLESDLSKRTGPSTAPLPKPLQSQRRREKSLCLQCSQVFGQNGLRPN